MAATPDRRAYDERLDVLIAEMEALRSQVVADVKKIDERCKEQNALTQTQVDLVQEQMRRMDEAIYGAEDSRKRDVQPGMLQMVNEVHQELTKRRAIGGFMRTALTLLGGGGLIGIGALISKLWTP